MIKLDIKPEDNTLNVMLTSSWYIKFWDDNNLKITQAFKDVTGLDFQQETITVLVRQGSYGASGYADVPMVLPADYQTDEEKLVTLMHELGHRLLGGNALGSVALGLVDENKIDDKTLQHYEHRHLYLFFQEAILEAFGKEAAEYCEKYSLNTSDEDYIEAWNWANSMSKDKRIAALRLLTSQALTRDRWHERDDIDIPRRNPKEWFKSLELA